MKAEAANADSNQTPNTIRRCKAKLVKKLSNDQIISRKPFLFGENDHVGEEEAVDILLDRRFLAERQLGVVAAINNMN